MAGLKACRTRELILNAAETLFLTKGYEAVSIDEICESVGMTKGAFYYHFKTKEDVLSSLFIPKLDGHLEEHYRREENASACEILYMLARCTLNCAREVGRAVLAQSASCMLSDRNAMLYHEERIHTRILRDAWTGALQEGIIPESMDFREFTLIYSSLATGLLMNWAAEDPASDATTNWDNMLHFLIERVFPAKKQKEAV